MKLTEIKCKNCGAKLKVNDDKEYYCDFCHSSYKIDDEVQHVKYDDMEQAGYEFEKGKIRARREAREKEISSNSNSQTTTNEKVGIFAWIISYLFYPCGGPWWLEIIWFCIKITFFPIVLTFLIAFDSGMQTKTKIIIISIIWLFIAIIGIANSIQEKYDEQNPWANECTSIEDFKYHLDEDKLYLEEYEGTSKKVKICSTYEIHENKYRVVEFTDGVFSNKDVTSIILPDGLEKIKYNTFNSDDIKYIYIPSSLKGSEKNKFYEYLDDVKTIYYGGTKEEWNTLTNNEKREKIKVEEIVYEAKIDDLTNEKDR